MNRRAFMLLAATAAIDRNPAAAKAKMPRIGFIQAGFRQDNQGLLDTFDQALATLGWTDSSTIAVLDRWAEERTERLPAIVKELIGSGVRVLVTAETPARRQGRDHDDANRHGRRRRSRRSWVLVSEDGRAILEASDRLIPGR